MEEEDRAASQLVEEINRDQQSDPLSLAQKLYKRWQKLAAEGDANSPMCQIMQRALNSLMEKNATSWGHLFSPSSLESLDQGPAQDDTRTHAPPSQTTTLPFKCAHSSAEAYGTPLFPDGSPDSMADPGSAYGKRKRNEEYEGCALKRAATDGLEVDVGNVSQTSLEPPPAVGEPTMRASLLSGSLSPWGRNADTVAKTEARDVDHNSPSTDRLVTGSANRRKIDTSEDYTVKAMESGNQLDAGTGTGQAGAFSLNHQSHGGGSSATRMPIASENTIYGGAVTAGESSRVSHEEGTAGMTVAAGPKVGLQEDADFAREHGIVSGSAPMQGTQITADLEGKPVAACPQSSSDFVGAAMGGLRREEQRMDAFAHLKDAGARLEGASDPLASTTLAVGGSGANAGRDAMDVGGAPGLPTCDGQEVSGGNFGANQLVEGQEGSASIMPAAALLSKKPDSNLSGPTAAKLILLKPHPDVPRALQEAKRLSALGYFPLTHVQRQQLRAQIAVFNIFRTKGKMVNETLASALEDTRKPVAKTKTTGGMGKAEEVGVKAVGEQVVLCQSGAVPSKSPAAKAILGAVEKPGVALDASTRLPQRAVSLSCPTSALASASEEEANAPARVMQQRLKAKIYRKRKKVEKLEAEAVEAETSAAVSIAGQGELSSNAQKLRKEVIVAVDELNKLQLELKNLQGGKGKAQAAQSLAPWQKQQVAIQVARPAVLPQGQLLPAKVVPPGQSLPQVPQAGQLPPAKVSAPLPALVQGNNNVALPEGLFADLTVTFPNGKAMSLRDVVSIVAKSRPELAAKFVAVAAERSGEGLAGVLSTLGKGMTVCRKDDSKGGVDSATPPTDGALAAGEQGRDDDKVKSESTDGGAEQVAATGEQSVPPATRSVMDGLLETERERSIEEKRKWAAAEGRLQETIQEQCQKLMQGDVGQGDAPAVKTKRMIQLKRLQLLDLQRYVRRELLEDFHNPLELNKGLRLRRNPKMARRAKQLEKLESRHKDERARRNRERIKEFYKELDQHREKTDEAYRGRRERLRFWNRHVRDFHKRKERARKEREERLQREKISLLKANDVEGYLRMVQDAKRDRVQQLLKQTEEYLQKLGLRLREQREAVSNVQGSGDGPDSSAATSGACEADKDNRHHYVVSNEKYYTLAHSIKETIDAQPQLLEGGQLREYQLNGLRWLVSLHNNKLNGILADEMGLGKTVQVIALISYLMEAKHDTGPFLIVVPSSVLPNWISEFTRWAPKVKKVAYNGTPDERRRLQRDELKKVNFNVLVTTYDYLMNKLDRPKLSKVQWRYIIIDEGHRIKNANCKLNTDLKLYQAAHRLLLTGTPIQNNLDELWTLLNFLLPTVFDSSDDFAHWFNTPFESSGVSSDENQVLLSEEENLLVINRLHQILRPFMLRRLKEKVENELPEKIERLVRCEASPYQKVLGKRVHEKLGMMGQSKGKAVHNTVMELRNICNHPFMSHLHPPEVEELMPEHYLPPIVRVCGKLEMLDRILPKLKAANHRVLFFTTMTRLLDVMEDYLAWKGFKYLRLDGATNGVDRGPLIESFNKPDSPYFLFLLSIRAGGIGINLQAADTVIIYDTDWNPQVDLQAQARAHRIGQKRDVLVLRLETVATVEERVRAAAEYKLGVANQSITAGFFDDNTSAEEKREYLEALLRDANVDKEEAAAVTNDDALNQLLARSADEIEIFEAEDLRRTEEEMRKWQEVMKVADGEEPPSMPARLVDEVELGPLLQSLQAEEEVEYVATKEGAAGGSDFETYGRGLRNRDREAKSYRDLTEAQFLKMYGEKPDGRQRKRKRAEEPLAEGAGAGPQMNKGALAKPEGVSPFPMKEHPSSSNPRGNSKVSATVDIKIPTVPTSPSRHSSGIATTPVKSARPLSEDALAGATQEFSPLAPEDGMTEYSFPFQRNATQPMKAVIALPVQSHSLESPCRKNSAAASPDASLPCTPMHSSIPPHHSPLLPPTRGASAKRDTDECTKVGTAAPSPVGNRSSATAGGKPKDKVICVQPLPPIYETPSAPAGSKVAVCHEADFVTEKTCEAAGQDEVLERTLCLEMDAVVQDGGTAADHGQPLTSVKLMGEHSEGAAGLAEGSGKFQEPGTSKYWEAGLPGAAVAKDVSVGGLNCEAILTGPPGFEARHEGRKEVKTVADDEVASLTSALDKQQSEVVCNPRSVIVAGTDVRGAAEDVDKLACRSAATIVGRSTTEQSSLVTTTASGPGNAAQVKGDVHTAPGPDNDILPDTRQGLVPDAAFAFVVSLDDEGVREQGVLGNIGEAPLLVEEVSRALLVTEKPSQSSAAAQQKTVPFLSTLISRPADTSTPGMQHALPEAAVNGSEIGKGPVICLQENVSSLSDRLPADSCVPAVLRAFLDKDNTAIAGASSDKEQEAQSDAGEMEESVALSDGSASLVNVIPAVVLGIDKALCTEDVGVMGTGIQDASGMNKRGVRAAAAVSDGVDCPVLSQVSTPEGVRSLVAVSSVRGEERADDGCGVGHSAMELKQTEGREISCVGAAAGEGSTRHKEDENNCQEGVVPCMPATVRAIRDVCEENEAHSQLGIDLDDPVKGSGNEMKQDDYLGGGVHGVSCADTTANVMQVSVIEGADLRAVDGIGEASKLSARAVTLPDRSLRAGEAVEGCAAISGGPRGFEVEGNHNLCVEDAEPPLSSTSTPHVTSSTADVNTGKPVESLEMVIRRPEQTARKEVGQSSAEQVGWPPAAGVESGRRGCALPATASSLSVRVSEEVITVDPQVTDMKSEHMGKFERCCSETHEACSGVRRNTITDARSEDCDIGQVDVDRGEQVEVCQMDVTDEMRIQSQSRQQEGLEFQEQPMVGEVDEVVGEIKSKQDLNAEEATKNTPVLEGGMAALTDCEAVADPAGSIGTAECSLREGLGPREGQKDESTETEKQYGASLIEEVGIGKNSFTSPVDATSGAGDIV